MQYNKKKELIKKFSQRLGIKLKATKQNNKIKICINTIHKPKKSVFKVMRNFRMSDHKKHRNK